MTWLRAHPRPVLGGLAALVLLTGLLVVVVGDDEDNVETTDRETTTTTSSTTTSSSTTTTSSSTSTTAAPATAAPTTSAAPRTTAPPPPPPGPGPLAGVDVALQPVANLDSPVAMAVRPGSGELWVAEQGGRVVALRSGGPVTVLDISADTEAQGERGLLGLAFSGDGGRVYLSFTNNAGDSEVDEFVVAGGGVVAESRRTIFAVDQPFANHNGGHLVLAPDGRLWLGLGDGGSSGDPGGRAQNRSDPLGKLLRLDPAGGNHEIYSYGLRNPWRFSFDRATDDLWLADVGQNRWEEVNRVPFGSVRGADFAWDRMEGRHPYEGGPRPGDVVPVYEYSHDRNGSCSVTGGFVYRGAAIPALLGAYLYGDYCEGVVRALRLGGNGAVADEASLDLSVPDLVSFGQDAAGELYTLSQAGAVAKIVPA